LLLSARRFHAHERSAVTPLYFSYAAGPHFVSIAYEVETKCSADNGMGNQVMRNHEPDGIHPIGPYANGYGSADSLGSKPPTPLQTLTRIALLLLIACCVGFGAEYLVRMTSN
jgi:hypothetical protein